MARTNISLRHGLHPLNAKETDLVTFQVASAYGTAICVGDPVLFVSTGTVARTPGGSGAAAATDGISGVVTNIVQYLDADGILRRNARHVPASTTYTADKDRTMVQVCLASEGIRYAIRTDTSVASIATARSLIGNNVELEYSGADLPLGLSGCRAVIGGAATTDLQLRIVGVTDLAFVDPTAGAFQLEVIPNKMVYLPPVGSSTTGV